MKQYWLQLVGRELYMQKSPIDEQSRSMQTLIDVELRITESENVAGEKYYGIELVTGSKTRVYYMNSKDDRDAWANAFNEALGYKDVYEVYRAKELLGQGHFGSVHRAVHKTTGRAVAIKSLHKDRMSPEQLEMQRAEIETLKVCQHPHICQLIDIFENSDQIFLVTEFMSGGDLFDYQDRRLFKLSEDRSREIAHQLATAIYYLHSHGIAHRDLKPENILMSDDSEQAVAKIADLGLAKILGPTEQAEHSFGTLVSDIEHLIALELRGAGGAAGEAVREVGRPVELRRAGVFADNRRAALRT